MPEEQQPNCIPIADIFKNPAESLPDVKSSDDSDDGDEEDSE